MIDIQDIRKAQEMLRGRVHRTPVLGSRTLGRRIGATALLKVEAFQRTGSFKARGVLNRLHSLTTDERERGLVTVSAGNHAQAVAWGSAQEGVRAVVVMPEHASPAKVAACREYGADIVLHGDVFDAFARMEELRAQHGYTLVHPFDDPAIIAGQGTVGAEMCEDIPDLDVVIVPVGGGGLLSGVATAVRALRPRARIIGVEPMGAPALRRALDAGHPVRLERVDTIADGLGAPMTGPHVLEHVRATVDDVVTVSDESIADALRFLLERCKLLVEPAGAAGVAALLDGTVSVPADSRVAVVLSGGNIDLPRLRTLLPCSLDPPR
ncbi:MAG: pyridoxal-phosphate dependent enzyme [Gemmatimonadetes bacterium]|nr:pyridoxal-phosphate dependent enzyme [Gemmatimonadota bacterium]